MPGLFITFEGPEGSGKTSQASRLVEFLREHRERVRLTREPGGTHLGEQLRSVVLADTPGDRKIVPLAEALLFNAARAQLVAEVIRPALDAAEIVVCDRFADSTLAYQGYGSGVPITDLMAIADAATGGLIPDLTILLDLPPEVGLARKPDDARNRFEVSFDLEFHRRVRDGFLDLARRDPGRWAVIDATRPSEDVFVDVRGVVADWV